MTRTAAARPDLVVNLVLFTVVEDRELAQF
jgi:hypothetical protein